MLIARVVGNVISTQKHEDYKGHKLLIVKQVGADGEFCGPEMIAVDGADSLSLIHISEPTRPY